MAIIAHKESQLVDIFAASWKYTLFQVRIKDNMSYIFMHIIS